MIHPPYTAVGVWSQVWRSGQEPTPQFSCQILTMSGGCGKPVVVCREKYYSFHYWQYLSVKWVEVELVKTEELLAVCLVKGQFVLTSLVVIQLKINFRISKIKSSSNFV